MSRPAKRTSYLSLWREFLVFHSAARRLGLNRRLGKHGMNVSTVFPEGYVENDRAQRHASSIPKVAEGSPERRHRHLLNKMITTLRYSSISTTVTLSQRCKSQAQLIRPARQMIVRDIIHKWHVHDIFAQQPKLIKLNFSIPHVVNSTVRYCLVIDNDFALISLNSSFEPHLVDSYNNFKRDHDCREFFVTQGRAQAPA
ncbi:hypothetical protein DBV15_09858 [Temnothorax longispinosus]|uniref:Uncharacterized protein n=1 Tax=Temnothorax longispinosus TaxID=300112 RepID=A0A4S2L9Q2_9HYME|nr:hypothetical protein DBV15_09858 [Temnothorax longispinosus]